MVNQGTGNLSFQGTGSVAFQNQDPAYLTFEQRRALFEDTRTGNLSLPLNPNYESLSFPQNPNDGSLSFPQGATGGSLSFPQATASPAVGSRPLPGMTGDIGAWPSAIWGSQPGGGAPYQPATTGPPATGDIGAWNSGAWRSFGGGAPYMVAAVPQDIEKTLGRNLDTTAKLPLGAFEMQAPRVNELKI